MAVLNEWIALRLEFCQDRQQIAGYLKRLRLSWVRPAGMCALLSCGIEPLRHFLRLFFKSLMMIIMSDSNNPTVEVLIRKKDSVIFSCPHCRLEKKVNVEKIKDVAHWSVGATCTRCSGKFTVSFNFRQYFRKETSLEGELLNASNPETSMGRVHVKDLSLTGAGLLCEGNAPHRGDMLVLRFFLDDDVKTKIEKKIQVESVRGQRVGASFVDEKLFDAALGKYVLSR